MNQQNHHEDDKQTASLADLPLTGEQAEVTKAGMGRPAINTTLVPPSPRGSY